ncbi:MULTISPECIES: polysaccharide ABC transporter ATP-binding protein [Spirulina sp. CCY15215]|uniref:ABC transporter ATP-binding protein n=1 Tax=Spirulina sp. CCY15215 TaxID=2767591 RepID=UPI001950FAE3|nr:polysaccharide ABC transporter ATP-binding protein [Spirulina major]
MSQFAIKTENLGKKYIIGHQQQDSHLLRYAIANQIKNWQRQLFTGKNKHRNQEEFWALKDISFQVKQGDRVGIIGRNGAGKSTLLKLLGRITAPTTGRIHLQGRVASLLEVGTGFHPELTGRENIYLNGSILGMSKFEIRKQFDEIVAFAEIERFLDTPVKRYSSGMYVRLAFAIAAHLAPEILVIDEVLAVGDVKFQKKCLGKMESVTEEGRTVLFVSHNMTTIKNLCNRGILLQDGQIKAQGDAKKVVDTYLSDLQQQAVSIQLRDRSDRQGSGDVLATSIRFGTQSNLSSGYWITGEDATLNINYECQENKLYQNIEVVVRINYLDLSPFLYLGTNIVRKDIESVQGSGCFRCQILNLPIEMGCYSISIGIKLDAAIVDWVEAAAFVEVREGDYYQSGRMQTCAGFLCNYSWTHLVGNQEKANYLR